MKPLIAAAITLALCAAAEAQAPGIQVMPNGSRPTVATPPQFFTGSVLLDPLFAANAHSPVAGGHVSFAPGARSHWHTYPAGQTLIVTSGTGWVQEEGGEKKEIKPGDVIWTPPGVRHWHGATTTNSVSHIAVSNMRDGKNVDWLEQVTDAQYSQQSQ